MKHIFIVNPLAGKGQIVKIVSDIKAYFAARAISEQGGNKDNSDNTKTYSTSFGTEVEYVIEMTEHAGHAEEIARRYSSEGKHIFYCVGGDGTLNEVLNGMAGSESAIAMIPAGSGNDFVRSIFPSGSRENLVARTIEGKEQLIDMALANGKYFVNISSVGFDAQVAFKTNAYKKLPLVSGDMAYTISVLLSIMGRACKQITLDIDGKIINADALLAAIGNGQYYGGGKRALPEAALNDGLLDVCLVRKISRLKMLLLFPRYSRGEHASMKEVSFYRCKKIVITSPQSIYINIDGEVAPGTKLEIEVLPASLRFIVPK